MSRHGEEQTVFEIGIVVPKKNLKEERVDDDDEEEDCVDVLVSEMKKVGLIVERVVGLAEEFIKVAAPLETLGRAAAELEIKKLTNIGMELKFEWEEIEAFVRQPDGSLFSWCERFRFFNHLIYGIVNKTDSFVALRFGSKEFSWKVGEFLLKRLETEGVVKHVFPLHDEIRRKQLKRTWALNWLDFTCQPIDEIYSYFGTKVATHFAFLGMYTRWIMFPAGFGLILQLINFGPWQLFMLPIFFIFLISWAVLFFQFWKRKNSTLLLRWQSSVGSDQGCKIPDTERSSAPSHEELKEKPIVVKTKEKEALRRAEWFGHLLRCRNDAMVIMGIICLQLPFELAYAHLNEVVESDTLKFGLTAIYLFAIQYLTRIGGKFSVRLIKYEKNGSSESRADSLVYKVFGLYFMQSYIGLFYHALRHRNFKTLRQILIQRLIVSQVFVNLLENSIPYLKYSYTKYRAVRKKKHENGFSTGRSQVISKVEKEYLKPAYSASIGEELEDGLFDDFLELAIQFGMIMMFACAFPLAFSFAALNNIIEIRTDALKLLVMLKRPAPRNEATIGAWLNIFQFLIVMSICTNCVLLVCLYDEDGKWKIEPGLAAILIMEHVLLMITFGFSHFVPEEPAWVKANRVKNDAQAQNVCSRELLRSISGEKKSKKKNTTLRIKS